MTSSESDDEPIRLSSHALAALAEFNAERDARHEQFEKLKAQAEEDAAQRDGPISMEAFSEDWQESQFWYSDETARLLAEELLKGATAQTTIGVVSAPSVFVALKNILKEGNLTPDQMPKLVLLEHDNRFGIFPEFTFYDYNEPFKLPAELKGTVHSIVCDPPFLNENCQTKAAMTVKWLAKENPRIVVCTGERMQPLILKLYKSFDVKTTTYEPSHSRGLSNEFFCYANFDSPKWAWRT